MRGSDLESRVLRHTPERTVRVAQAQGDAQLKVLDRLQLAIDCSGSIDLRRATDLDLDL